MSTRGKNNIKKDREALYFDAKEVRNSLYPEVLKIVSDMGYELVDFDVRHGKKVEVSLEIYHKEKNISIRDCEKVSNVISRVLDVKDLIPVSYNLVVSSPGADRVLRTDRDFEIFVDRDVEVRIKNYDHYGLTSDYVVGKLVGKEGEIVKVFSEGKEIWFDFSDVRNIRLYFDIHKYLRGV